jgi:hypothetical protein
MMTSIECRLYETMEALRAHAEGQPTKGEIQIFRDHEGIALVPADAKLPARVHVFRLDRTKDIDTAERIWGRGGEIAYARLPVTVFGVEIVTPDGQRQCFSGAVKA